jgi:hypothetical protein
MRAGGGTPRCLKSAAVSKSMTKQSRFSSLRLPKYITQEPSLSRVPHPAESMTVFSAQRCAISCDALRGSAENQPQHVSGLGGPSETSFLGEVPRTGADSCGGRQDRSSVQA